MSEEQIRIDLCDGKYTYILSHDYKQRALRYGEEWRQLDGDKFVLAMASELQEARAELAACKEQENAEWVKAIDERNQARADLAAAQKWRDDFCMDYRIKCDEETKNLRAELAARDVLLRRARAWIVEGKVDFNDVLADDIDAALTKGGGDE